MVPVMGDTWSVRAELKALGARWNARERTWYVPADRAEAARVLVGDNARPYRGRAPARQQTAAPAPVARPAAAPVAMLAVYGQTYQSRAAIKAMGGRWNRDEGRWYVPASRAADIASLPGVFVSEQAAPPRGGDCCSAGPFRGGHCTVCDLPQGR